MQCTPIWAERPVGLWLARRGHTLAMVSLVLAALLGQPLESSLGWEAYPPAVVVLPGARRQRRSIQARGRVRLSIRACWAHLRHTWQRALVRSELWAVLWLVSGGEHHWRWLAGWGVVLPWIEWLLEGLSIAWPWLGRQPEMGLVRWGLGWLRWGSLLFLGVGVVGQGLRSGLQGALGTEEMGLTGLLVGGVLPRPEEGQSPDATLGPGITAWQVAGGRWIRLAGEFYLPVSDDDPFWRRMAILQLRQLEGPTARRGSRATRDGRRPLVTQQRLAACFGVPQPDISRWERYRLAGDWANLLSLQCTEVLTVELRDEIVRTFGRSPWWGQQRVYEFLRQNEVAVTGSQVRQAARDSGWVTLQQMMGRFFVVSAECIRPRDEGLVRELLAQVERLLSKLEAGEGLTVEERLDIAHLQTLCAEMGLTPPPAPAAVPWAQKVKWLLFAAEATLEEGVIRCTYCGSSDVRPKGRKPRTKRYLDEAGQWQTVEVYRYRCRDRDCSYGSFTHLPLGLLPHSPYRLEMRLSAVQMYVWGRSSYRRTADAMGVKAGRVYQWVSALGQDLLPVAALFGVVKSSGVVGVDEKWVQVPDKAPRGSGRSKEPKPRRWMYVYLAVDVYTYDLLHIAIYAHNTGRSTRAFLLALRAKGYKPQVIVTDLRREYGPAIRKVFPKARHHECIFHALQWTHRQLKEVYGTHYAETSPAALALKEQIDDIFQVKTRRTAEKRYTKVMALRDEYVAQQPEVASIFDTLERHWPTLVNGIESQVIPRTNNTVELVIRRFEQHYQNFCGFESIETARLFLAVFEKVYRFTPFTDDAQPRIRGKCPLELAGYDISGLPMTEICRGQLLRWPLETLAEVVPNA